jgi:serine/threonine protein kinase/tetratricopeptide (TPR) repeat protein
MTEPMHTDVTIDPEPPRAGSPRVGSTNEDDDPAYQVLLRQTQLVVQKQVHGVELPARPAEPMFLGRYRVESFAGKGGMGTVLAAEDVWLERRVALKLVNTPGARERRRLVREGVSLAKLSHPNVVQVHDVALGERDELAYVAMEYVEGSTLARWQGSEARSLREILDKYLQAARGLYAAHQVGIVHRDFKPHNVLIDATGTVKVADFGLASATVSHGEDSDGVPAPVARAITAPQAVLAEATESSMGLTPGYCAPEQLRGERPTEKADQFAFCVALYEGITGCLPFGACRDPDELAQAVVAGIAPRPEAARIPRRLQRMLARGLALRPEDRFGDIGAIIAVLEPRPSRWSWGALALVPLAAVLTAVLLPKVDPCASADEELLRGFAEPPSRSRAQADASNPMPWGFIDDSAAAYRQSLQEASQDLCRAGRRGEIVGPAHEQGLECLRTAVREFELVTSLVTTEGSTTDPFVAFGNLRSPALCIDSEGRPSFGPADPELQHELDEIRALRLAGRDGDALPRARALHERALAVGDGVIVANISFLLGKLESITGDGDPAATHLEQASLHAEGLGDDVLALDAYAELLDVAANLSLDPAPAARWEDLGAAKLRRTGRSDSQVAGQYYSAAANLAYRLDDFPAALEHGEHAIEVLTATTGPESLATLIARTNHAAALVGAGRAEQAIAEYQEILELRRRRYGSRHTSTLQDELRLAWARSRAGDAEGAVEGFAHVEQLAAPATTGAYALLQASAATFHCRVLVDRALAQELPFERALPVCERAFSFMPLFTSDAHDRLEMRSILQAKQALVLAWQGRNEPALELLEQERELLLSALLPVDPQAVATNTSVRCAVLQAMGRAEECGPLLERNRRFYDASGRQDELRRIRKRLGLDDDPPSEGASER